MTTHQASHSVGDCQVRHRTASGAIVTEPLFAAIMERGGVFKILSFSSNL